jgi:glycosyltransferase involved in cell wall biosynthesis
MAMDTPFRGDLRQRLARLWLHGLLRRIDRVVVPGERGRAYATRLGVPPDRIHLGLYAYDQDMFHEGLHHDRERRAGGWPRRFLFVGRYVPEKALDVLMDAYRRYRSLVNDPWPLGCCGHGPLGRLLTGVPGVHDHGFVQPDMQPSLFADHGVFVLPSRYEPWGVAVAEAMASGLPAICSSACNAAVSLLHPYWNGLEVPAGDAAALARAMRWMHDNERGLPEMGRAAAGIAKAYAACQWAVRWREICLAACRDDRQNVTRDSP